MFVLQKSCHHGKKLVIFFSPGDLPAVRQALLDMGYRRLIFDCPITQTVYFAQTLGQTTSGGYVRIRRYTENPPHDLITIAPSSHWYFEGKISGGIKERVQLSAGDALDIMANPSSREGIGATMPRTYQILKSVGHLLPVVATQWAREHYLKGANRATIDTDLKYFAFPSGECTAELMAEGYESRVEWKTQTQEPPITIDVPLTPIIPGWHEAAIRLMYAQWLSRSLKTA